MTMVYVRAIENGCFFFLKCAHFAVMQTEFCVRYVLAHVLSHCPMRFFFGCVRVRVRFFPSLHHMLVAFVALLLSFILFFFSCADLFLIDASAIFFNLSPIVLCEFIYFLMHLMRNALTSSYYYCSLFLSVIQHTHLFVYHFNTDVCTTHSNHLTEKNWEAEEEVKIGKLYQLK